ncbi:MAG: hypothetical protein IT422_05070 [Pirellulaceae bacterium]|nr:hypothetical protein [Pirellulaceae bacterium]
MAFQCTIRTDVFASSLNISSVRNLSGDLQAAVDQVIPASTTNQEITLGIDVSELTMIAISSDVALTIKTNDSGSPDDTLNIAAGVAYVWGTGDYNTLLLTADVTSIFVTSAALVDANLKIIALVDLP